MEANVNRALVRQLRINRSWSQEKLAEEVGVSVRTVQRVEADGVASLNSREAIAGALGVSPSPIVVESELQDTEKSGQAQDAGSEGRTIYVSTPSAFWLPQLGRGFAISLLWLVMVVLVLSAFIMAFGGVSFWELTDMSHSQSAGIGIGNGLLLLLMFLVVQKLYQGVNGTKISKREACAVVSG